MNEESGLKGATRNAQHYAHRHPYYRTDAQSSHGSDPLLQNQYSDELISPSATTSSYTGGERHGHAHRAVWQERKHTGLRSHPSRKDIPTQAGPSSHERTEAQAGPIRGAHKAGYDTNATVIIIGMKGVGKTTLGLIANRTLGRRFIDTDQVFRSTAKMSLEAFVQQYGWSEFRERETALLADLLQRFPQGAVIACGGGIIETAKAREILATARSTTPVIRILREEPAIRSYIDARWLGQYDEDLTSMIERRRSLYSQCSSHTFYNLTSRSVAANAAAAHDDSSTPTPTRIHPMKFKLLGESFMRLVRFILGLADDADAQTFAFDGQGFAAPERMSRAQAASRSSISHLLASHGPGPETGTAYVKTLSTLRRAVLPMRANVLSRSSLLTRRTTAMSMTFPDLTMVDPAVFRTITQGVDALEVRVDMLGCMQPASPEERRKNPLKVPELDYEEVARQLETLRQAVPDIPILFTLRSDREGGFFHDDRRLSERDTASPHSQRIYFEMLELAIALGVEMLDVELGWDPWLTKHLISSRGRTRIVPSYHDLAGALRWDSALPQQLYERACSFGNGVHIVMMIGTTQRSTIEQNNHLIAFSARSLSVAAADPRLRLPPLMALNMGMAGRPSRPFNDVLNFVSHPAMPVKAGRGQFTLKEMMEMLVSLSILQVSHFHLYGDLTVQAATAKRVIQAAFNEFGLPYTLLEEGSWTLREYVRTHQRLDIPDRDVEVAEPNSISDGLYIVGQAHRQLELFSEMKNASPQQVSVEAQAVQAIDIIAREDMALSLLGTERGRHAPNSLGEMRGPLVGCHTLPASIKRILKAYLAPINAPNVHRSGLIVILSDKANGVEVDEEVEAETDIAKRSALYALATIGFGTVYVVDEASCLSRSRDALSRRPSLSLSPSPRDSPVPTSDTWERDVSSLVNRQMRERTQDGGPQHNLFQAKHIGLRALSQSVSLSSQSAGTNADLLTLDSKEAQIGDEGRFEDEDAQTAAAILDFERNPSKRPCAVIIVGGSAERQEIALQQLKLGVATRYLGSSPDLWNEPQNEFLPFILPRELWDSYFGGTIVRLPSKRTLPFGVEQPMSGNLMAPATDPEPSEAVIVERNGWIDVPSWVLDRDRVERTVIESWTRRSAPTYSLLPVWKGDHRH